MDSRQSAIDPLNLTVMTDEPEPAEQVSWLAVMPVTATVLFYLLPLHVQDHLGLQFMPQMLSYIGFLVWFRYNSDILRRLGLLWRQVSEGLLWGTGIGLLLGGLNSVVILAIAPHLGWPIEFLRETPHARVPIWLMVPWIILFIAVAVEVNFRGFILGRLVHVVRGLFVARQGRNGRLSGMDQGAALACSAATFAFDPFLVSTFRHLHWIAVWDGLVWGWAWLRTRNLYVTIVAHAVEVVIVYLAVKSLLR